VQGGRELLLAMISNARNPPSRAIERRFEKIGGLRGELKDFIHEQPLPLHPPYRELNRRVRS
jgi:hypothetical protein